MPTCCSSYPAVVPDLHRPQRDTRTQGERDLSNSIAVHCERWLNPSRCVHLLVQVLLGFSSGFGALSLPTGILKLDKRAVITARECVVQSLVAVGSCVVLFGTGCASKTSFLTFAEEATRLARTRFLRNRRRSPTCVACCHFAVWFSRPLAVERKWRGHHRDWRRGHGCADSAAKQSCSLRTRGDARAAFQPAARSCRVSLAPRCLSP